MGNLRSWLAPIAYLGRNPTTLTGAVLTTSAAITILAFVFHEVTSPAPVHAYAGIVVYMILPVFFVLGLLLIPLGAILRRRSLRKAGTLPATFPRADLADPLLRKAVVLVALATVVNIAILGFSSYGAVEHMDSVQFCGTTCHTVMQPEYTAYVGSPHSRVKCVQCHIGPGASWFVRAKLDGLRQVVATSLDTYSRPIPSPVHQLRPARETCEQCHWPRMFGGDQLRVKVKFSDDEKNTRLTTVLLMRIGGHASNGSVGIHGRHLDERERIHYVPADERRQEIGRVRYVDDKGETVDYLPEGAPAQPAGAELADRAMDCIDCHNRPTHAFETAAGAVDRMMREGRISTELPFAKKKAVELISAEYKDRDTASAEIVKAFTTYYGKDHPEVAAKQAAVVKSSAEAARDAYLRNVFPAMKVTWGTHPNNVGHEDFPGCFRCHDDKHKSKDGRVISQDCGTCHAVLAMEETNPKVLADLGVQ